MAFFNNSDKQLTSSGADSSTTIITSGTKITGDIRLSCNLYIDGFFEGNIYSQKEVNIGVNGQVKGEINAHRVVIQGLAEGSLNANKVDIKPEGKVKGTVESEEFIIEAKGIFEGNSLIKKAETTTKEDSKASNMFDKKDTSSTSSSTNTTNQNSDKK
ncbi:bactofilin family protein [Arcobacter porcinus]|uniref:bactofilin family protein n=1 Tax=Arcobacter porcinus TaxID=1935204 RepID=UPI0009F71BA2|nr:polymer-forming cytoskeletal protein [Arcobacter porcinus]